MKTASISGSSLVSGGEGEGRLTAMTIICWKLRIISIVMSG